MKSSKNKLVEIILVAIIIGAYYLYDSNKSFAFDNNKINSVSNINEIPEYDGSAYVIINNNEPNFEDISKSGESFEVYSELDSLESLIVTPKNNLQNVVIKGNENFVVGENIVTIVVSNSLSETKEYKLHVIKEANSDPNLLGISFKIPEQEIEGFDENTTEIVNERKKQKQREQHSDKIEIINLESEELNYDELELERLKKEIEILESRRNALLSSPNIDSDAREIGYKKLSEELESKRAKVLKIVNRIDELKRRKVQREEKYKKRSTLKKDSIYDERPDLDTLTSDNKPRQFTYYLVEPDPELVKELESAILEERTQLTKVIGIRQRLQQIIANVSSFTSYEQYTSEKKKQEALYEEAANLLEEKKSKVRTIRREVELSKLPKESKDYLSYGEQIEELQTKKKDTFSNRLRRDIDAQIEMLKQQRRDAKSFLANAGIYGYTQKVYRMPRC